MRGAVCQKDALPLDGIGLRERILGRHDSDAPWECANHHAGEF